MRGYEDEYNARKQQLKKQKELEDAEYRKQLVDVGALEKAEKEKEQLKKKNLLREQLNDLDLLNKKKDYENQRKKDDEANMLKNQKDPWGKQYNAFRDNLAKKNNRIFGNASKYNNVLGTPLDPNIFNAKSDDEFNKLLAEAKAKEKNKIDPTELEQALKNLDDWNKGLKKQKEDNKNRQKLYKEYLDNQTELDKLNKIKNNGDDMRPQLLMPAYYYPNLPEPVYHKARDSLLASKNQEEYFGKDMNNFFRGDASSNTLINYEGNNRYLGDSKLRHNPITCPVNDYYYNKYVNKLKKESEYIPHGNNGGNMYHNRSMNNLRDNLVINGQQTAITQSEIVQLSPITADSPIMQFVNLQFLPIDAFSPITHEFIFVPSKTFNFLSATVLFIFTLLSIFSILSAMYESEVINSISGIPSLYLLLFSKLSLILSAKFMK